MWHAITETADFTDWRRPVVTRTETTHETHAEAKAEAARRTGRGRWQRTRLTDGAVIDERFDGDATTAVVCDEADRDAVRVAFAW